jgi:hypothetical protein
MDIFSIKYFNASAQVLAFCIIFTPENALFWPFWLWKTPFLDFFSTFSRVFSPYFS